MYVQVFSETPHPYPTYPSCSLSQRGCSHIERGRFRNRFETFPTWAKKADKKSQLRLYWTALTIPYNWTWSCWWESGKRMAEQVYKSFQWNVLDCSVHFIATEFSLRGDGDCLFVRKGEAAPTIVMFPSWWTRWWTRPLSQVFRLHSHQWCRQLELLLRGEIFANGWFKLQFVI